jgi:hypothetical protein
MSRSGINYIPAILDGIHFILVKKNIIEKDTAIATARYLQERNKQIQKRIC